MQSRNILSRKNKRKLGKSKTRKGGLGKNERPGGLKTCKRQFTQKLGALKKEIKPAKSKTRKGGLGKKG
jgi:hypothetical protein